MIISLVCSHGGHLTELLLLLEAFNGHSIFLITYDSPRTRALKYKRYLIKNIGINPLRMIYSVILIARIFTKEKPNIIVSTGSEIAIPAFLLARIFNIKTVFIESWCRIYTKSGTGKIVYPLSDLFLVQWTELLTKYGKKAKFIGAIVE